MPNEKKKKNRRRYGSYYWQDPVTKLGYCKIQVATGECYSNGKPKYKTIKKRAKNITQAQQIAEEIFADYSTRKAGFLESENMTFNDLAEWYKETHAVPPQYADDGTKIAGIRTYQQERNRLDYLKKHFGKKLISEINETDINRFKLKREKEVAAATINRDLEILRAMFRRAVRRRWLKESPFDFGDRLIEKSRERRRDVVLSAVQEEQLLLAAKKSEKSVIYYVILCLLDTGARPSEIYDASTVKAEPVKWIDFIEFDYKAVRLTSYKGRKKLVRFAPVSSRLELAMRELWEKQTVKLKDAQIFEVKSLKTAWRRILRETKLTDIRLRDLRRSFSTKLANIGIENDLRQRILGHEKSQTTFDYTSANLDTALMIRHKLELIEDVSDTVN